MSESGTEERLLHVPLERVFAAFVEPQYLRRWMGLDGLVELRVGGAYDLSRPEDGPDGSPVIHGAVVEVRPPEHLVVGWSGEYEGRLELDLEPTLGGTRVRFRAEGHHVWEGALDRLEAWLTGPKTR